MNQTVKIILIAVLLVIGTYVFADLKGDFSRLSPAEQLSRLETERDLAIRQAVLDGNYHCCISPPCTMCYFEANEWNNHTKGTCACDDLIAQGKEPCPQCRNGLVKDTGYSCELTSQQCDHEIIN